jgi:hypothetical protein
MIAAFRRELKEAATQTVLPGGNTSLASFA